MDKRSIYRRLEEHGLCPYLNMYKEEDGTAIPKCMCPDDCCGYPWYCPIRDNEG